MYLDRGMWEKVVLNLLSNALKFTFDGAIRVAVRAEDGRAVVTVADTGIGVPAAEMPRLFERFHRIENARSRSNEGSGIGLALVKELVGLHGGTITADSAAGAGTTLHHPAAVRRRAPAGRRAAPARTRRRGLRHRRPVRAGGAALAAAGAASDDPPASRGRHRGRRTPTERARPACWSPTTTPTCAST